MSERFGSKNDKRLDFKIIYDLIPADSRVLDLGCGDGTLLEKLKEKNIKAQGIEIDYQMVKQAIDKGLNVVQMDLDLELMNYKDASFDYVILNKTLQATHKPLNVIKDAARIGKNVIVSFNNFAYWEVRSQLFFKGTMPKNKDLPYEWYDTPNIHLVTIHDFDNFCENNGCKIIKKIFYNDEKIVSDFLPNVFSPYALYLVKKQS
ncbi:MAG: methionine biosynthesis protein MetW [Candidatus Caenarcaniphilales bacterium]|nr:methionine biosynthesis protein MetW [Candidatus Caenarcaniphilales bacterium]